MCLDSLLSWRVELNGPYTTSLNWGRVDYSSYLSPSFLFLSSEFSLKKRRLQVSGELFQTLHPQGERKNCKICWLRCSSQWDANTFWCSRNASFHFEHVFYNLLMIGGSLKMLTIIPIFLTMVSIFIRQVKRFSVKWAAMSNNNMEFPIARQVNAFVSNFFHFCLFLGSLYICFLCLFLQKRICICPGTSLSLRQTMLNVKH